MTEPSSIEAAALKPCPFCGGEAEIERYGDHSRSTIYQCTSCSCSLESGEEWGHGRRWNERACPAASGDLRERIAETIRQWTSHSYMQLHAGEMTAQERRTVCAVVEAIERQVCALPGLDEALASLPAGLNWLIGKGRTRPDEPLYGVQLIDPESGIVVGETEHDDLSEAVSLAIRSLKTGSGE